MIAEPGTSETAAPDAPEVSVLIVAYDSERDLERSLPSLYAQRGVRFEVIAVDNTPKHSTATWLRAHYPAVRLIESPANTGYAGGNNLALQQAQGRFIFYLNPDTCLSDGALAALVAAAKNNPDALIGAKLLCPDGKVNACGLGFHYTGITTCRGLGEDDDEYRSLESVPLLSGAALLLSRDTALRLRGFDESYFMYHEDVDLSLRARLLGYRLLCAGNASIMHDYKQKMSAEKVYYLERNRLQTLFKVYARATLLRLAPGLLLTEVATWGYALLKGPAYLRARWCGYVWLYRHRQVWRRERRRVQRERQVSDRSLLEVSQAQLPFEQLLGPTRLARLLSYLTKGVYRFLFPRRWLRRSAS